MCISDCTPLVTLPEGNVVSFECFAQGAPMTPAALSLVVGINLKGARYLPKTLYLGMRSIRRGCGGWLGVSSAVAEECGPSSAVLLPTFISSTTKHPPRSQLTPMRSLRLSCSSSFSVYAPSMTVRCVSHSSMHLWLRQMEKVVYPHPVRF